MRMIGALVALVMVLATSTIARADDDGIAELTKALVKIAPGPGLDQARGGPPGWCGRGRASGDSSWSYDVASQLSEYRTRDHDRHHDVGGEENLFHAAKDVCAAPTHPAAQRAAVEIEQLWINETGLAEADAIATLAAHLDDDKLQAERTQLCSALPAADSNVDDHGNKREQRVLHLATRRVFGCDDGAPLWQQSQPLDNLAEYLDRGSAERDPIARLARVVDEEFHLLDPDEDPKRALLGYVVDQFDLHDVPVDAVMHVLDGAPFRGNPYARATLLETVGRMRLRAAQVDVAIGKLTRDATWKELLVTAPQRGAAAWAAAAQKRQDALARSDAFDLAARADKDIHGCETALRADFIAIAKSLKHDTVDQLRASLSDDLVAGLLLSRLAHCMKLDGNGGVGKIVGWMTDGIRVTTGPRSGAFWAALDALTAMKRGQRPFDPGDVPPLTSDDSHDEMFVGFAPIDELVIGNVVKKADGVHVTFPTDKRQVMSQQCVDGDKVDRIRPDGKVEYRKVCHDTGLVTVDQTPRPRLVPPAYAAGVKAGRLSVFTSIEGGGDDEDGERPRHGHGHTDEATLDLPAAIFADKAAKKLVVFYGFPLE